MLTYITHRCLWIASSKVCWLKSLTQLVSLNCIIQKFTDLRHLSALVLKKGMLTYITYRCLWIASSKVCWLKSPTQLVSLNCIIQKYADLHHPSSWLLLILKKSMLTYTTHRYSLNCFIQSKLTLITHAVGVFELYHSKVCWLTSPI